MLLTIPDILGVGAESHILSLVVQGIAVDVVNKDASRRRENFPMHQDNSPRNAISSDCVAASIPAPLPLIEAIEIRIIDQHKGGWMLRG